MSKSYRIRTQPGVDKSIKVLIDQEFDYLEILSLKILQSEIYTRQCADYGVIVGRISVNNGFGIPNAKVSVFIPIDSVDQSDPIISELYPYKSLSDVNDDGYRYNLLPYVKSYSAHVPTGTFFTRTDVLTNPTLIQVYDKYYKYNATTNDSGDYMIFGVPVGAHTVVLDVDLSDIGEFSLSPQDLIRMGIATEAQVSGTNFKSSNNLRELPQIVTVNRTIEVEPLWGQPEICNLGITRTDFDLSGEANVDIRPTSVFMGSIISGPNSSAVSSGCRPPSNSGHLCNLTTGPGEILAIRQTIRQDINGRPILENFSLEGGGKVIDENGTWLIDVPMNLDYYITNEFGEQVLSNDPEKGIPTKGKYRFKVKWSQSSSLSEITRRAYFLVPNIRENVITDYIDTSYAFSVDWEDYAYSGHPSYTQVIQDAINCDDRFYMMQYNKVYTVSQFISGVKQGSGIERYIGIKNILDDTCSGLNYRFPTNDGNFRFDILYIIFMFFSIILTPIFFALILILHILYFVVWILRTLFLPALALYTFIVGSYMIVGSWSYGFGAVFSLGNFLAGLAWISLSALIVTFIILLYKIQLTGIKVPILTYPDCSLCSCSPESSTNENIGEGVGAGTVNQNENERISCTTIVSDTTISSIELSPGILRLSSQNTFTLPIKNPSNSNGFFPERALVYSQEFAGLNYDGQYASNNIGAPYLTKTLNQATDNVEDRWIYTTSLPMADRVNLFNLKTKYFDNSVNNPGGGVNRIKVSFETGSTKFHYDNTIVIICDKGSVNNLNAGQIISFQNPSLTKDINLTGGLLNVYGNKSITGTTSTGLTNISIYYAKTDGTGNVTTPVQYNVNITATTTNNYHKFPTDFEYFQVITGMTYSDFSGKCVTNEIGFNSLNERYLRNTSLIAQDYNSTLTSGINQPYNENLRPIEYVKDYGELCVLILNRGVDPFTPKVPISYGLGRLFGYSGESQITVTGNYRMNVPIQGEFKNISHSSLDLGNSNVGIDSYTNQKLYFNSFSYRPQVNTITGPITGYSGGVSYVYTGVLNSGYSGFNSNLISYYSSMDNRSLNTCVVNCGGVVSNVKQTLDTNVVNKHPTYGLNVSNLNHFTWKIYQMTIPFETNECEGSYFNYIGQVPFPYQHLTPQYQYSSNTSDNQGYFYREIVEGGGVMYTNLHISFPYQYIDGPYVSCEQPLPTIKYDVTDQNGNYSITSNYFSPIYNTTGNTIHFTLGTLNPTDNPKGGYQTVMRGDRLPTSTNVEEYCCNGMVLQKNTNFKIFLIPEDGVLSVTNSQNSTDSAGSGDLQYTQQDLTGSTNISRVFDSFTCGGSVNLECYGCKSNGPNGTITIAGHSCQEYLGETIFEYGCYRFVTTIFLSLLKDWGLMFEWIARNMVMLGACRNVFSHRFVNNWVNGVLYAFPIKTEVLGYTSPNSSTPNQPIVSTCTELVNFHEQTKNYYYRVTSYDVTNNIFKKSSNNYIGFPTTIMDLGPRTDFLQELVMSDEYDGYVVNRLDSSSFGTVDDILNLFIVSRFIDNTFLKTLLGSLNILAYFSNSRPTSNVGGTKLQIDADYAQLISINSELGVAPFLASNYPDNIDPTKQNPIFFDCDNVLGIFFSSDTQVRDYITPKRTIINGSVQVNSNCSFNNFPVYSQEVPFSQWYINANGSGDSIFGRQFNNWDFNVDGGVFSKNYQSMDRLTQASRYYRTNGSVQTQYQKGYIYAVKTTTDPTTGVVSVDITSDPQYWDRNNPEENKITVGAPFHFYFGLRRGASAFDRFKTKWINSNNVTN
jgi:hypothetical protein